MTLLSEAEASRSLGLTRAALGNRRRRGTAPAHVLDPMGRAWYDPAGLDGHEGRQKPGPKLRANVTEATRRQRWIAKHGNASHYTCRHCRDRAYSWEEVAPGQFEAACRDCRRDTR